MEAWGLCFQLEYLGWNGTNSIARGNDTIIQMTGAPQEFGVIKSLKIYSNTFNHAFYY